MDFINLTKCYLCKKEKDCFYVACETCRTGLLDIYRRVWGEQPKTYCAKTLREVEKPRHLKLVR